MNYTVAKRLLREVEPLSIAAARAAAGIIAFGGAVAWLDGRRGLAPSRLRRAFPLGLLGVFANQILFIEGLKRTSASHSAILIALLPVHVLILSAIAGLERIALRKAAGVLVAFAGVVLVATEGGFDLRSGSVTGDLLTLCAGLAFAAYTVAGKPVLQELGALRTTAGAFLSGGALILLAGAPAAGRQDWSGMSGTGLLALLYVLLGATVGAYFLYYYAVDRIQPTQVAAFMYLQPVVACLFAYAAAGDRFTRQMAAGTALILAGVVLAERG